MGKIINEEENCMNSDAKMICRSIDKLTEEVTRLRKEIKQLRNPIFGIDLGGESNKGEEEEETEGCPL